VGQFLVATNAAPLGVGQFLVAAEGQFKMAKDTQPAVLGAQVLDGFALWATDPAGDQQYDEVKRSDGGTDRGR
jgi:hypothetical protein